MLISKSILSVILILLLKIKCKQQLKGKFWYDWIESSHSIDDDNCIHTTRNIATEFHKPVGGANSDVLFVYIPHTIFNYTWTLVSGSMNDYPVNTD